MSIRNKRRLAVAVAMALLLIMIAIAYAFIYLPWAERRKYPLRYSEEIQAACEEFGLDPYLITAMARQESSFRPEAVSRVGAIGLMQVMPETGEWIAGNLGITDYDPDMLKEPAYNARIGCWYIDFLLKRYDGQTVEALTAYNQGHGTVDGWLKDGAISVDGKSLQTEEDGTTLRGLPAHIKDGKVYANRIITAREKYEKLYPDAFKKGEP